MKKIVVFFLLFMYLIYKARTITHRVTNFSYQTGKEVFIDATLNINHTAKHAFSS